MIGAFVAFVLAVLGQSAVDVVITAVTPDQAVIYVDCAVDGNYAKALDAAWQIQKKSGGKKKVEVECKKTAPTNGEPIAAAVSTTPPSPAVTPRGSDSAP